MKKIARSVIALIALPQAGQPRSAALIYTDRAKGRSPFYRAITYPMN